MTKRRGPVKEGKNNVKEDKRTGYGDKKLEGPNRPST